MQEQSLYDIWFETGDKAAKLELFIGMSSWMNSAFWYCSNFYNERENKYFLSEETTQFTYLKVGKVIEAREIYISKIRHYFFGALDKNCIKTAKRIDNKKALIDPYMDVAEFKMKADSFDLEKNIADKLFFEKIINEFSDEKSHTFKLWADGYSMIEIAEILSIPSGTVKSRIHNMKKEIKSKIKN